MLVDLISATTRDGLRLDGMYQTPATAMGPLDAVVCVHGTGSNFYGSTLFDALGAMLLELGIGVLRVNTRGHDLMSNAALVRGGGRRAGAAYERLDECCADLAAWIGWLKGKGHSRIGLVGHSSGAVKCLYALANEPDTSVTHCIALSPPRLSHSLFAASENGREFSEMFRRAKSLVEAGEGNTLLDVRLPLPFVITATGYVEKYGPDERYDYVSFLRRVRARTLVTLGAIEVADNMAFRGSADAVAAAAPGVKVVTIPGADHFYSGVRDALLACVREWVS